MRVQWPVEVKIEAQKEAGVYELKIRAREEYLKPDGMVADIDIEAPDGSRNSLELESRSGWLRTRVETSQDGLYRAHIKVSAQTRTDEIMDVDLGMFSMLGVYREVSGAAQKADEKAPEIAIDKKAEAEGIDWKLVGVVIVVVNLSLFLLLILGWWLLKRGKDPVDEVLEDEEEFGV